MKVATLSIGDELLFGETVDTNAAGIAARLYACGFAVDRHCTVGDQPEDIAAALIMLAKGHDAVIATGGLGPTSDDLTAVAAAEATADTLVMNEIARSHLTAFLHRRGRELFPDNEKQALLPSRAAILPNPNGTACGFRLMLDGCRLFFLPGVPSEMASMLEESIIPELVGEKSSPAMLRTKVLKVFGISEAETGRLLDDLSLPGIGVAYCVEFPIIQVKLRTFPDHSGDPADLAIAVAKVRERLGDRIVAEDDDSLETIVARLLAKQSVTVAVAESCSGGLLSKRLTDIPGSSAYFLAGAVTYSNAAKSGILGVAPDLIERHGAVSSEVASAMAEGIRHIAGSDISMAVTGITGPAGGSAEKPVGTVFLALSTDAHCHVKKLHLAGSRAQIRIATVCHALDWLRRHLLHRLPANRINPS